MKKAIWRKGLVVGIAAIFVCLTLTPAFSRDSKNISSKCEKCEEDYSFYLGFTPLDMSSIKIKELPLPSGDLPPSFDWRNYWGGDWTTPIRNQGQCGSCWAFGAMGALEAAINIEFNDSEVDMDLSEQYLVSCFPGHGCDEGGHAYYGWKWLDMHGGALPESCFPYEAEDVPCEEKCESWEDFLLPIGDFWTAHNPGLDEIKNALIENGPLVADMAVYDDLFGYRGGVYEHPGEELEDDINHQPVIVGYNDNEGCWIVKNSWGTRWGEDTYGVTGERGWFRIRYGDCCIGTGIHGVESDIIRGNDTGRPMVELIKPLDGWLYLFDNPIREVYFGRTKIIGSLSVTAEAWDVEKEGEEISGIDRVEFYLDDTLKFIDKEEPYSWELERRFGFHEIRVISYDNAGNPSEAEKVDVLRLF